MRWTAPLLCGLMMCQLAVAEENSTCNYSLCDAPADSSCCDLGRCDSGNCGSWLDELMGGDCGLNLGGLLKPSDHCFDDFISPMTNPVFFEDPRTLTEARFIFINHSVPGELFGNEAQLYAVQLRAALTENLSLIATKDGFIVSDNALVNDGWADVAAGLKYNVYKDVNTQTILSLGTTFEMPVGTPRALQGNGDGEFHLFATGGTEIFEDWHYVTGSGFRLPVDSSAESQVWYWSNHLDYQVAKSGFYLLGETNWYHWMKSGDSFPAPVEGVDLFNLGSRGVAGNDIVTAALGVKYKASGNSEIGVAFEVPVTDRKDILQNRLTVDWIVRY